MNQNFSPRELVRFLTAQDLKDHRVKKLDVESELKEVFNSIVSGTFEFVLNNEGAIYYTPRLTDKLILRKLNDNIKRIYKDEQSNRRVIINQIITLLPDRCPYWILRTDVSKYYESIDRDRSYSKLYNDAKLSYFSLFLLRQVFDNPTLVSKPGLPRGLGISSTLSEIYMRRFDRYIKGCSSVYFYSRFVDDILIFSNNEGQLKKIQNSLDDYLEEGLKHNKDKTALYSGMEIKDKKPLEYLGYRFLIKKTKTKEVKITIAEKKVKKIKSRLVLSFVRYLNDSNFALLENRIKFLCTNYSVKSSSFSGNTLKAGIYYNYHLINDLTILKELNIFYYKLLNAKSGTLGSKLSMKLAPVEREKLQKYSFKNGFEKKIINKFTYVEMKSIKKAWLYE